MAYREPHEDIDLAKLVGVLFTGISELYGHVSIEYCQLSDIIEWLLSNCIRLFIFYFSIVQNIYNYLLYGAVEGSSLIWNNTLFDPQIVFLSVSILFIHFMYVCKVPYDAGMFIVLEMSLFFYKTTSN